MAGGALLYQKRLRGPITIRLPPEVMELMRTVARPLCARPYLDGDHVGPRAKNVEFSVRLSWLVPSAFIT